jgi:succinylarginine dihydrolase
MTLMAYEVNFEGLAGMTHHFGGLSPGNLPSMKSAGDISHPKEAALQGLKKMALLHDLGIRQAVLPPHERPFLPLLRQLGFLGLAQNMIEQANREWPWIVPMISSSATMWTANWASCTASIDSADSHLHFTPANLASNLHRSIEGETTQRILKAIFPNPVHFSHHLPLPCGEVFFDEGSANQIRLAKNYRSPGITLFVYGKFGSPQAAPTPLPKHYPARQTKEASQAVARLHQLYPGSVVYAQQHPEAIDAGIFHNDLIAQGNLYVLLVHERAFWRHPEVIEELKSKYRERCSDELHVITVTEKEVPLKEASASFMFNSQLVTLPDLSMALIAPHTCQNYEKVALFFNKLIADPENPVQAVHYVNLSESLNNGGGPACLRMRVVLTENELSLINPGVIYTKRLHERLEGWIGRHYPEELALKDLIQKEFHEKNCHALDELCTILEIGKVYPFQLGGYV